MRRKLLGAMNNHELSLYSFRAKGFKIINYIYARNGIIYYITKDYSESFNISFNGIVLLEVTVLFVFFDFLSPCFYPVFKEKSNIIPKIENNHINPDGSICYAPPSRPINEKWKFIDFVNAVDSMLNNYFSTEYIGKGNLFELEHGIIGLKQYENLKKLLLLNNYKKRTF